MGWPPSSAQFVIHDLRAFHFADEGCAGFAGEDLAAEDEHQHVAINGLAVFVHRADTIGIAIEGNAQFRFVGAHGVLQMLEIGNDGGIGMMIREAAIHFEEQFDRLDVKLFKNAVNGGAGGAVAGIEDDFDAARQGGELRGYLFDVRSGGVYFFDRTLAGFEIARLE